MSKNRVRVKDPNYRAMGFLSLTFAILFLGSSTYFGIKYYNGDFDKEKDGSYNAIVDVTAPIVEVEVLEKAKDDENVTIRVAVKDEEGGSALYGLCVTDEESIEEVKTTTPECWDTFPLLSQIEYNLEIEFPLQTTESAYYLSAKDNFGNYSEVIRIIIPKK